MPAKRPSAANLNRLHSELCFTRAFPNSIEQSRAASEQLHEFDVLLDNLRQSEREKLAETGIAGTLLYYRFSFEVASWLARNAPGEASIDWPEIEDSERLDELLRHVLEPSEDEYFDSGYASSQDWIGLASADCTGTDFDWLMAQLGDKRFRTIWAQLFDAADLPLIWNLKDSKYSKSRNVFPVGVVETRDNDMRGRPANVKKEIQRPVTSIRRLSRRKGQTLIDVAMASLAARHRETLHFNHANRDEVYLADVGKGVSVAVFGLLPDHRFPLECTMGYLILSNGVPLGYGGASLLFRQANTGVNLFDEYRGSEASYLWVQVMRVYHALVGCTRFIANPYQFGGDNDEALKSGAFWFYYKLGYRPVDAGIRELAGFETAKKRKKANHRSSIQTLRKLASCDMHLTLPGARAGDLFDEEWLATSSFLATKVLSTSGARSRRDAAAIVTESVARDLRIRSLGTWSLAERRAFDAIAPIVAAAHPAGWSAESRRSMRKLLRAKGGACEAPYARLLCSHDQFLAGLRGACRGAESSQSS